MRYVFLENFQVSQDKDSLEGTLSIRRDWSIFDDHFPGFPLMPGALIVEAFAQHTVALMLEYKQDKTAVIPTLIQVDRARFLEFVIPDATLKIVVKKEAAMYPNFKFGCEAFVGGNAVATARLTMAFRETPGMGGLDFMGFFLKGGS